jgi:DNA primase
MNQTKSKTGLVGVLLIVGMAAVAVVQYQTNGRLRSEVEALQQQTQELSRLREENERLQARIVDPQELDRLRQEHAELIRLRGQAASMRAREAELAQVQAENRQLKSQAQKGPTNADAMRTSAVSTNAPRLPAEAWANVGFATPAAAFQTLSWAIARRDTNTLANSLIWADAPAREAAEAAFAAAPDAFRARYGSLDGFIHSSMMEMANTAGFRIGTQVDRGDRSVLAVERESPDGSVNVARVQFQREGDTYRQVLGPGMAEKMIQNELRTVSGK